MPVSGQPQRQHLGPSINPIPDKHLSQIAASPGTNALQIRQFGGKIKSTTAFTPARNVFHHPDFSRIDVICITKNPLRIRHVTNKFIHQAVAGTKPDVQKNTRYRRRGQLQIHPQGSVEPGGI
jgi:hypothetical protein